jgi:hypothetical protein
MAIPLFTPIPIIIVLTEITFWVVVHVPLKYAPTIPAITNTARENVGKSEFRWDFLDGVGIPPSVKLRRPCCGGNIVREAPPIEWLETRPRGTGVLIQTRFLRSALSV